MGNLQSIEHWFLEQEAATHHHHQRRTDNHRELQDAAASPSALHHQRRITDNYTELQEAAIPFSQRQNGPSYIYSQETWRYDNKVESTPDDDDDDDDYRAKEATPFTQRRHELCTRYSQLKTWRLGKQTEPTADGGDDYRAQAALCAQRRNQLFARSREAWRLGQKAKAKSLSDAAKAQAKLMAEANKKAAETLFSKHNAKRDVGVIDLHGLFVKEAIARVKERIALCKEMGRRDLVVIVGRGNHSKDGNAILKPMVEQFMQEYGLSITAGKPNDGCIYVQFDNRGVFLQIVDESCALM